MSSTIADVVSRFSQIQSPTFSDAASVEALWSLLGNSLKGGRKLWVPHDVRRNWNALILGRVTLGIPYSIRHHHPVYQQLSKLHATQDSLSP